VVLIKVTAMAVGWYPILHLPKLLNITILAKQFDTADADS